MSFTLPLLPNYICLLIYVSTGQKWRLTYSHGKDCKEEALSVLITKAEGRTVLILLWKNVFSFQDPKALWNLGTRNASHIFGCLYLCSGSGALSFCCSSQTTCLQMDISKCLIHYWMSEVWKGQLTLFWACLSFSAAIEFLFQIMWLWQAVYHSIEKDLHPSLDLILCYNLTVGLQTLQS